MSLHKDVLFILPRTYERTSQQSIVEFTRLLRNRYKSTMSKALIRSRAICKIQQGGFISLKPAANGILSSIPPMVNHHFYKTNWNEETTKTTLAGTTINTNSWLNCWSKTMNWLKMPVISNPKLKIIKINFRQNQIPPLRPSRLPPWYQSFQRK